MCLDTAQKLACTLTGQGSPCPPSATFYPSTPIGSNTSYWLAEPGGEQITLTASPAMATCCARYTRDFSCWTCLLSLVFQHWDTCLALHNLRRLSLVFQHLGNLSGPVWAAAQGTLWISLVGLVYCLQSFSTGTHVWAFTTCADCL